MKWTGLGTLAFAAMLTIACTGDGRDDRDESLGDATVTGTDDVDPGLVGTSGQRPAGEQTHGATADARQFASQAAEANRAEVELGELAVDRAQSQEVKQFAQMMIRDHSKAGEELKQAVKAHNVAMPDELAQKHQTLMARLRTLSGAEFDREYMKAMVEGHTEVRSMLRGRADAPSSAGAKAPASQTPRGADAPAPTGTTGGSPLDTAVNQWASKALPTVEHHLEEAEQIQAKLQ